MTKKQELVTIFILLILTIVSFSNFTSIGFVNSDDADCYIRAQGGNILNDSLIWAKDQGRFFFIYRNFLASIPYLFESKIWIKTTQYLPIVLNFILASIIIANHFKSKYLGYLTYICFLFFFSIPVDEFTPPIAYPFLFSLDVLFFLISFSLLLKFKERKNYSNYLLSLVFFFIPFVSFEAYVIFLPIYLIYSIYIFKGTFRITDLFNKETLKVTLPVYIIFFLYICVYVGFRIIFPSNYSGNQVSNEIDFLNFLTFVWNLNKPAYPTVIFFQNLFIFNTKNNSLVSIFIKEITFINFIFSLITTIIFHQFIKKINLTKISKKKLSISFMLIFIHSYLLNVLPAITDKYKSFKSINSYVTTYLAFYGISISLVILILLIKKCISKHKLTITTFNLLIICCVFVTTIIIQVTNKKIKNEWQKSNQRFEAINYMSKHHFFDKIPQNSILIVPQLFKVNTKIGRNITTNTFSWSKYIFTKTNRKYFICENIEQIHLLLKEYNVKHIFQVQIRDKTNNERIKSIRITHNNQPLIKNP